MSEQNDPKIGGLLFNSLGGVVGDIYAGIKSAAIATAVEVQNEAAVGFSRLLRESYERRSKVKSILDPDRSLRLRDIYVDAKLIGDFSVTEEQFLELLEQKKRVVIVGKAGAGKSLLLKSMLLRVIDEWAEPIPIFVELKNLNEGDLSTVSVEELILNSVKSHVRSFDAQRLQRALYAGKFMLMLDALDEVDGDRRASVAKQIVDLSERNQRATIVVTSRPDPVFGGWEAFDVYSLVGLDASDAEAVIVKLPYDDAIKAKFVAEVLRGKFDSHKEFLSVPLLLVIMLLVYHQFAEVPQKIVNFYGRAFETLFSRHDSLKSGYRRKLASGLAYEDFRKVFAAFCISTYVKRTLSFSRAEAADAIARALRSLAFQEDAEAVLSDLVGGLCLLQEDGDELSFVHRSFQEYFAALYLTRVNWPSEKRIAFVEKHADLFAVDNTSTMMRELDFHEFECGWVLTFCNKLLADIEEGGEEAILGNVAAILIDFMVAAKFGRTNTHPAEWHVSFGVSSAKIDWMVRLFGDYGIVGGSWRDWYKNLNKDIDRRRFPSITTDELPASLRNRVLEDAVRVDPTSEEGRKWLARNDTIALLRIHEGLTRLKSILEIQCTTNELRELELFA